MEKGSGSLKLPRFSYESPASTTEVIELLESHGPAAKILAGGQSLIPLLSFRMARPEVLIDLNGVPGLEDIRHDGRSVRVGALVRHRAVELDDYIISNCRMIGDAMAVLGHVAIRNRGTVGGSLAHADPAGEWPAVALALDASLTVTGPSGTRAIPVGRFFQGYMTTALQPHELLTEVSLTMPPPGAGSAFVETAYRHGDFAQAGAGAVLSLEGGRIVRARVALLGVGAVPLRPSAVEDALLGEIPGTDLFTRAAALASEVMEPLSDVHADAEYKRHLGIVMIRRALERAHQRVSSVS